MRYSGPRMLPRHPVMTIMHFFDGLRKKPVRKNKMDAKCIEDALGED